MKNLFKKLKCKLGFHKYIKYPIQRMRILVKGNVAEYEAYDSTFQVCKYCNYNPERNPKEIEYVEVYH